MKAFNKVRKSILVGCVAVGALSLLAPMSALADGKGASKLMATVSTAGTPVQPAAAIAPSKSCPICVDGYTKVVDHSAKGMRAGSLTSVAVHRCPACQTTISTVGSGKATVDKIAHTCGNNSGGQGSCCTAMKYISRRCFEARYDLTALGGAQCG